MDEDFFVNIADPVFLETYLLSDTKSFIELSIVNQRILDLKSEKAKLLAVLKTDLDEISTLFSKLDEKLPHKELLVKKHHRSEPKSVASKKKSSRTPKVVSSAKIDKLSSSLAEIEKRLQELS